jgi:DNA-binding FadR family transcriptional regulator
MLYALSKSPKLVHMINGLQDQIYRYRELILKEKRFAVTSNRDHIQLLKLIRKRDAEGAEQLVRDHILRGQEMVLKEYDRQRRD